MSVRSRVVALNTTTPALLEDPEQGMTISILAPFGEQILIGGSDLASSNGYLLQPGEEKTYVLDRGDAIYALAVSGTPTTRYLAIGD